MRTDTIKAHEMLKSGGYTLVLVNGDDVITDTQRGVKPLLDLLDNKSGLRNFSAADKVVGKAAAFLYVLLGAAEIYADVISKPALDVLLGHDIAVEYGTLTDAIRNRAGDGFCPMETAVIDETEPQAALEKIREKLREITKSA